MTIKLSNGVEVIGEMKKYYLMAEYDRHMIPDEDDYLLFIASMYHRAGMRMDTYPKELFDEQDKPSSTSNATEQER